MAKSSANLALSRFCVSLLNMTAGWSQASRTRLANILGFIAWYVLASRRHVTLTNLRLCFPEKTEEERVDLAKKIFKNLMRAAVDHSVLWKGTKEDVLQMVRVEGKETLIEAAKDGVIVVAPHFVGLDACGICLNTFMHGASLYQKQSNPVWDEWALHGRKRFGDPILIPKSRTAMREVLELLKEKTPFYYLPDMDHGARNSVFVPFFGVPAATLPMVSRLARVTKCKVMWGIAEMTDDGYVMHLSEPLKDFPTRDYVADTARLNRELEEYILKYPDQYLWTHRRFKTRPEGESPVY